MKRFLVRALQNDDLRLRAVPDLLAISVPQFIDDGGGDGAREWIQIDGRHDEHPALWAMGCSIWIRVALMASLKENRQFTVSSHISVIAAKVTCPQV